MTSSLLGLQAYEEIVRELALAYPESREVKSGESSEYKVREKTFATTGWDRNRDFRLEVKLPESKRDALRMNQVRPFPGDLGQHGWVSCTYGPGDEFEMEQVSEWLSESFRAVAPKKLVERLRHS